MKIVAIVQARMGSSRLPGKSALALAGRPMLWHVLNRLKQCEALDEVVLALPIEPLDNTNLAAAAWDLDVKTLRIKCDVNDLLKRYWAVAKATEATIIVRVPGDNPCVDPDEVYRIVETKIARPAPSMHYLTSNLDQDIMGNGYPGGLGAEVYDVEFLEWLERTRRYPPFREHPHKWAFSNGRVMTCQCPRELARPELRFDVNTAKDFDFVAGIYSAIYPSNPNFRTRDVLAYLEENHGQQSHFKPADHRLDGEHDRAKRAPDYQDPIDRSGS